MFGNNLVFWWCCALMLVASSSKHQRNKLTNKNEKHDISTAQYKIDETSIKNYDDENKIDISTIYRFNKTDYNEDSNEYFVPHKVCVDDTCLLTCCHLEDHLTECIPGYLNSLSAFVDGQYSLQSKNQEINLTAYAILYDPCKIIKKFYLYTYKDTKDVLIANSTVYYPYHAEFVESKSYCLRDVNKNMLRTGCNITMFNINFPTEIVLRFLIYKKNSPDNPLKSIFYHYKRIRISLRIISILFLLTIFLVYSILPQLRNKHGFILRNYIGATIAAYIFESANKLGLGNYFIESIIDSVCYFGFLAAYFWLTVMSFDMWWTFRLYRDWLVLLHSFDYCSVSSICLFISTALKIRCYEKNTTHHLRNVDSRVYDENKKWFNLCQKWFIMMFIAIGISAFFIGIVSLIFPYTSNYWYIDYIAYLMDIMQNIGIFILFVCKKRIKKLLLTRFGYQNYNVPPIARQTEVVTDSNTRTIRSRMNRLRERINLWQTIRRRNNMHDETAM